MFLSLTKLSVFLFCFALFFWYGDSNSGPWPGHVPMLLSYSLAQSWVLHIFDRNIQCKTKQNNTRHWNTPMYSKTPTALYCCMLTYWTMSPQQHSCYSVWQTRKPPQCFLPMNACKQNLFIVKVPTLILYIDIFKRVA